MNNQIVESSDENDFSETESSDSVINAVSSTQHLQPLNIDTSRFVNIFFFYFFKKFTHLKTNLYFWIKNAKFRK